MISGEKLMYRQNVLKIFSPWYLGMFAVTNIMTRASLDCWTCNLIQTNAVVRGDAISPQPVANKPKDDTLVVWHFIFCKWLQAGKSGKVTSKKCPVWTWESWFTNNWKVKWGQLDITIWDFYISIVTVFIFKLWCFLIMWMPVMFSWTEVDDDERMNLLKFT